MPIILSEEKTWPPEVIRILEKNHDVIYAWEALDLGISSEKVSAHLYDKAHEEILNSLAPYNLKGYHCTCLTDREIDYIRKNGMSLQNLKTLEVRLSNLIQDNLITKEHAISFKNKNQSDDDNRAGLLWFLFDPPNTTDEDGIRCFFSQWGGEALYNSHEDDPVTGPLIKNIGHPCLIEADVPISSLSPHSFLTDKIIKIYLKNRGLPITEPCELEAYAERDIPAENIVRVLVFPDKDFILLTGCDVWEEPLTTR